jgi:glycosyltransferase involved in cell wall biosynthesis
VIRLRIGVISEPLNHPLTGIGRYARNVLQHLPRLAPSTWKFVAVNSQPNAIPGMDELVIRNPFSRISETYAWYPVLRVIPRIADLDLVHNPGQIPTFFKLGRRYVITIFDLTPLLMPESHREAKRLVYSTMLRRTLHRAHLVIASSFSTKRDIERLFGLRSSAIRVTYLAADPAFRKMPEAEALRFSSHYFVQPPFFMAVGTLEPRKNLRRLLFAFAQARRQGLKERLVLVGRLGWGMDDLVSLLAILDIQKEVVLAGYIPDHHLVALYNLATALVYPSLYEGFGIPPLEAMRCGSPVIASNRSSLPEVLGDSALFVDPEDENSLASALLSLSSDSNLRERLIDRGLRRSTRFSWERTVRETLDCYRFVLERT